VQSGVAIVAAPTFDVAVADVDLAIAKTVDDTSPDEGQTITYTVTLTNNGPLQATNIVVTDVVPSGVTYVGSSIAGGDSNNDADPAGTGLSWTVNSLNNSANTTLTFDATVDAGEGGNTIANTSIKSQDQDDTNATADDPSEDITVNSPPTITKTFAPDTIDLGNSSILTLTIGNPNSFGITGVAVTDNYPAQIINATPSNVATTCTGGTPTAANGGTSVALSGASIGAGGSCTVTVDVTGTTVGGPYTNTTGVVTSTELLDSATASDDLTVTGIDLSVSKSVDDSTPDVDSNVVFTVTVSNAAGLNDATGVAVTDLLPGGFSYVSDDAGGNYVSGTGVWTVGNLAAGAGATLNITATVLGSGVYTNAAEVTAADQYDIDSTPANAPAAEDDYDTVAVTPVAIIEFDAATASDAETSGGNIPLLLVNGTLAGDETIDVNVTGGSASAGTDFTNTVSVTIPAGTYDGAVGTAVQITLSVNDDSVLEGDETIDFQIGSPSSGLTIANVDGDAAARNTTARR
jgi:uncharacterized repeat protein (TIGR01451 family)